MALEEETQTLLKEAPSVGGISDQDYRGLKAESVLPHTCTPQLHVLRVFIQYIFP